LFEVDRLRRLSQSYTVLATASEDDAKIDTSEPALLYWPREKLREDKGGN